MRNIPWSTSNAIPVSACSALRHWNCGIRSMDRGVITSLNTASIAFYAGTTYAWQEAALDAALNLPVDAGDDAIREAIEDGMPDDIKSDLAAYEEAATRWARPAGHVRSGLGGTGLGHADVTTCQSIGLNVVGRN